MFGLVTVDATFHLRAGEIHVAEDPAGSTVQVTIDAASFSSGNTKRDRDVISPQLLDAAAYPEITFTGKGAFEKGATWAVNGLVGAHGATDPVEVCLERASFEGGVARFHATARLDRTRLGITKKKGMVGRNVNLVIDAVAVQT